MIGSAVSPLAAQGQPPAVPPPFVLNAHEQQRVDQILNFWESRSAKVKTYQCRFTRWEYDFVFGPKDPNHAKTRSYGVIKYAAPDKGMFLVETIGHFAPPERPGGQPTYPEKRVEHAEHWVCDGVSIFEFNAEKKQLIESRLPPELQGKAITDGPLPFLFGAKASQLKERYWIREMQPPPGSVNEYWLEAMPKTRRDTTNFQRVEVILDQKMFLPTGLQLFPPTYDPVHNPSRTSYQFEDRKVNNLVDQVQGFMNSFVRPRVPDGWTKHVEVFQQPAAEVPLVAPATPRADQARRPTKTRQQ
jgi:TIGR03009 family protein